MSGFQPYDVNSTEGKSQVDQLQSVHEQFMERRRPYETLWAAIAERLDPMGAAFMAGGGGYNAVVTPQSGTKKMFDSTAALALSRSTAAVQSLVTPRHERYQGLRATQDELNADDESREWMEAVVHRQFAARNAPDANFEDQSQRHYWNIMAYGTGGVFTDEALPNAFRRGGLRYKAPHLGQLYIGESWEGRCDRVNRAWRPNSRQIAERFKKRDGGRWSVDHLPYKVKRDLDKGGFETWAVVHCCAPNENPAPGRLDWRGMAFTAHYYMVDERAILETKGYRNNPWAVSRYQTAPEEEYGRSAAWLVMPDILQLSEIRKTMTRRGNLITDPPVMTVDDNDIEPFNRRPGAINAGWLDSQGRERAKEMQTTASLDYGLAEIQDLRGIVHEAFHLSLFEILATKRDNETATAALIRAQEKGQLLAPILGRQQSEFLGVMSPREIDLLNMAGQLPPMPQALAEAGGQIEIDYDAPLNRMQMSGEAIGLLRTVEILMPLAQIDPEVMDAIDTDEVPGIIARSAGAPAKGIRSKEQIAERRQRRAAQQQQEQMLAAAPLIAKAVKDLSQSQVTAQNSPPAIPYLTPGT